MPAQYEVVWGSGDVGANGIFDKVTGKQVVSPWQLRQRNLSSWQICTWSDRAIERLVDEINRN